jgi:hypothetical protein
MSELRVAVGLIPRQREQTAAEPLRGRTAPSMLFLSALK